MSAAARPPDPTRDEAPAVGAAQGFRGQRTASNRHCAEAVGDVLEGVEVRRRSSVALDLIDTSRRAHERDHRRPPALTAREALAALQFEALLIWTAAANIRGGIDLADDDFSRLTLACSRITVIYEEVLR